MLFHLILPTWSSQSYMKEIPKKDALPTGNYAKFQVPTVYSLIKQKKKFLKNEGMNVTEYMSALVNTEWWMPANIWMSYLWQPSWRPVETTVLHAGAYFSYSSSERIFIQLPYSIPQVCHYVPNILTFLLCSLEFSLYEFLKCSYRAGKDCFRGRAACFNSVTITSKPSRKFFSGQEERLCAGCHYKTHCMCCKWWQTYCRHFF